ncbi:MAG: Sua5/YciO/YrdC/YwlC family protein [Solirubrobacterales bacterium]|nr:Sua5/YciO/YrdC/YwlC family protein [Solirubrobacterales bacterium]
MTSSGEFERCIASGGVAVFPSDTVYGLACDPDDGSAVKRLYELKGRSPSKPSAVMFFDLQPALDALADLGPRTREALERLLPGPVTVLLENAAGRWPLACGEDPATVGLRVAAVPELEHVGLAVLQSSANRSGGPDASRLLEVPEEIREGADLVLDGGELPGTPSAVVDLRQYEREGAWSLVRAGAVGADTLAQSL